MDLAQVKIEIDTNNIAELDFVHEDEEKVYKPEVSFLQDDVEVGDFVVKIEENDDVNEGVDQNDEESQQLVDDDNDDMDFRISSSSSLLTPAQLKAMTKYSANIAKDLQTKVKKVTGGFACRICGIVKSYRDGLRGHLSTHRDRNPFLCPISECCKLFPTRFRLMKHIEIHFPPAKLYSCKYPNCKSSFRTLSKLKDHKCTHTGVKKFICHIPGCHKRFSTGANVSSHLKTHLNPEKRPKQVCPECGMEFLSKVGFFHHVRRHKGIFKEKKYPCYFCQVKRDTPSAIEMHLRSHTLEKPFQCGICKIWLVSAIGLKSHGRVHDRERVSYPCPQCPLQFKWKMDLGTHLRTIHDENAEIFYCPEASCDYKSVRAKDLRRHKKNVHLKLRPYTCTLCPKSFSDKAGYKIHLKMHGTRRQFKCKICSKGFVTQPRLKYHEETHSEEKKYPCPNCDKLYKTTQGREMHLKLTHGIGDDKKWTGNRSCYFCKKIYKGYSGYLKHLRMHTRERPYQCQEPDCVTSGKWLTSQENLVYHLLSKHGKGKMKPPRSDTDERFQCQKCPRDYRNRGDLMKHERISHDETAPFFDCPEVGCDYKTRDKKCLRQHKRVHSNFTYKCGNCGKPYRKKTDLNNHSKKCA